MPADPKPMLPCPFCGADAELILNQGNPPAPGWRVICTGCDLTIPHYAGHDEREYAVDQWNTRPHAPATQPGRVDLLELLDQAQARQKELEKALADLLDCHLRGTHGFPLHTELIFAIEEQAQAALKDRPTQAQEERREFPRAMPMGEGPITCQCPKPKEMTFGGFHIEDGLPVCNTCGKLCRRPAPTDEGKEE